MHAQRLKALAAEADAAARAGRPGEASSHWREALALLPPGSRQHAAITQRLSDLGREADRLPVPRATEGPPAPWHKRAWAALVVAAVFVIGKGKLLLAGLTKWKTLLTMLAFMGVYLQTWGWKFALGLVLGIYVHEMGHVAALRRYGIAASAPMFIPGIGAFVRMKQYPADARQDARVGLAGPVWGLAAGLVAWGVGRATGSPLWLAIAQVTGFINLFNLIPFWQLDGGRGFHALNRAQRWLAALVIAGAWMLTHQGLLLLLLVLAVIQALRPAPEEADPGAFLLYAGLILALTWLMGLPVSVV